jgi:calcineurin-like phosphoesterase family protein
MHEDLIARHNAVVGEKDTVYHAGDFAFGSITNIRNLIARLKGKHVFIHGSHDKGIARMGKRGEIDYRGRRVEIQIKNKFIVIDHYCLRVWARSHFNSWHLFGHSHGRLEPIGKSWDIGVDNNNFTPISFDRICEIMAERPDNPNLIPKEKLRRPRRN